MNEIDKSLKTLHGERRGFARLLAILILFIFIVGLFQSVLPVLEGNDELLHVAYSIWVRETWRLPDRAAHQSNSMLQETGQPPLTYIFGAIFIKAAGIPPNSDNPQITVDPMRNRWFAPLDVYERTDNLNMFIHGTNDTGFRALEIAQANRAARLFSLLCGAIAVLCAFGAAREVFSKPGQRHWVTIATAIYAFAPQMMYMSAIATNDITVTLFGTVALWITLRIVRLGASAARLLAISLAVGLCGLSKISGLLILPGVIVGVWYGIYDTGHKRLHRFVNSAGLVAAVTLVLLGPWMLYGWISYRDPLGLRPHDDPGRDQTPATLIQIVQNLPEVAASYWAKYGTSSIWAHPVIYVLVFSIVALSLVGFGQRRSVTTRTRLEAKNVHRDQVIVLLVLLFFAALGLVYWLRTLYVVAFAITGRLVYFIHAATAILLTIGLARLVETRPHFGRIASGFAASGLVAAAFSGVLVVYSAFAMPRFLDQAVYPAIQSAAVDFENAIRFRGLIQPEIWLRQDGLYPVTLCWEILQRTERLAAYTLKIFGDGGQVIAERTTIPGLGRYASWLWQPGDRFCDSFSMRVAGMLEPLRTYPLVLALLSTDTLAADWKATDAAGNPLQTVVVGRAASQPGMLLAQDSGATVRQLAIEFPALARLQSVTTGPTNPVRGGTLQLMFDWMVSRHLAQDDHQFIHLVGPGGEQSLADGTPLDGRYPLWAWPPGSHFRDTWRVTLPADLPAGEYRLITGFYDPLSGARLDARQDGQPAPDNSVTVLRFILP